MPGPIVPFFITPDPKSNMQVPDLLGDIARPIAWRPRTMAAWESPWRE